MPEFVDKEVDNEYADLDARADELEEELREIEQRQQWLRENHELA